MDIKIIIPTLVSSAYFLALFLFNLFKTTNILGVLFKSLGCSVGLFVIVYILVLYIDHALDNMREQESQKALEKIRSLEIQMQNESPIRIENNKLNVTNKVASARKINNIEEQDIEKLKRESGTQFDHDFAKAGKFNI